jgi:hypothetical protein
MTRGESIQATRILSAFNSWPRQQGLSELRVHKRRQSMFALLALSQEARERGVTTKCKRWGRSWSSKRSTSFCARSLGKCARRGAPATGRCQLHDRALQLAELRDNLAGDDARMGLCDWDAVSALGARPTKKERSLVEEWAED